MVDIGSGGGSPAIPLALAVPGLRLLMVESKTRKSVFLREATRVLQMEADVITSRFEALLTRPELHEAHDLLTIRAVRIDTRLLMSLQAFVKPGGSLFLFRSTDGGAPDGLTPPLRWTGTFTLVEPLRSRLVVLEKHVPRGT
jgi:16S rRNA (guanine527-N7)-methyltransferase